jgi:hypothetical protein
MGNLMVGHNLEENVLKRPIRANLAYIPGCLRLGYGEMRQDRSRIRQVRLSGLSGYLGYPRVTRVIARLSRLSY